MVFNGISEAEVLPEKCRFWTDEHAHLWVGYLESEDNLHYAMIHYYVDQGLVLVKKRSPAYSPEPKLVPLSFVDGFNKLMDFIQQARKLDKEEHKKRMKEVVKEVVHQLGMDWKEGQVVWTLHVMNNKIIPAIIDTVADNGRTLDLMTLDGRLHWSIDLDDGGVVFLTLYEIEVYAVQNKIPLERG